MRAIIVKWLGPTNTKPARIRVSVNNVKAKFYSREDYSVNEAVKDYIKELGWEGKWCRATLNSDSGVFVCVTKQDTITVK